MQLETILTIAGGATAAALIGLFGAWIQSRREHTRWLREQRITAYRGFMHAADHILQAGKLGPRVDVDVLTMGLFESMSEITLVGPDRVKDAATDHLVATMVYFRMAFVEDDAPAEVRKAAEAKARGELRASEEVLVKAARKQLGIRG